MNGSPQSVTEPGSLGCGNTRSELGAAIHFGIERWHAWAPNVTTNDDWQAWLRNGVVDDVDVRPDVRFLPPMLRRRLDRVGRMAMHTAWPCADGLDDFEYVFGSRHGSLARTVELLFNLVNETPLSPTAFSLSVHNGVAGLLSIARGNRRRATAMAAELDTLGMTLIEAAMILAEGASHVVVSYVEDSVPDVYKPLLPTLPIHPFAISLLLTPDAALQCSLAPAQGANAVDAMPEAALMRFLLDDLPDTVVGVDQPWKLERLDG